MENCEMILAGFGGQGILFTGKILAYAAMLKNKQLSWLPSYGPEMRGGTANCHVIISDAPIGSPIVTEPDALLAMNKPSLEKFGGSVKDGGMIFADSSLTGKGVKRDGVKAFYIDATETADSMGIKNLANMVMLGVLIRETGLFTVEEIKQTIKKSLPPSKAALAAPNMRAVEAGFNFRRR